MPANSYLGLLNVPLQCLLLCAVLFNTYITDFYYLFNSECLICLTLLCAVLGCSCNKMCFLYKCVKLMH